MRIVTPSQFDSVLQEIVALKKTTALLKHEVFTGVPGDEMMESVRTRLGDDWMMKENVPVKLTREDINAVAASRFFKSTGMTLLLAWALIVAITAMFTTTYPVIPPPAYYAVLIVSSGFFMYIYTKKQKKMRKDLNESLGIDSVK